MGANQKGSVRNRSLSRRPLVQSRVLAAMVMATDITSIKQEDKGVIERDQ